MKTHLLHPGVLADEHPKPAKRKPAIDFDSRKPYQPEERIIEISVQPVVSLPVEVRGENYLLPIYFHGFASFGQEMKESLTHQGRGRHPLASPHKNIPCETPFTITAP